MADIMFKMDRIINAIHDAVPPELWEVILHKIGGPVAALHEFDDWGGAEDRYVPMDSAKADEHCWTATVRRDPPVEGRRVPTRTIEAPVIRKFTPTTVKDEDDF